MYSRCCLMIEIERCVGRKPFCSFLRLSLTYFSAVTGLIMGKLRHKCREFFCSRGCFGCCTKPQFITAVDQPSKGLKIQGRAVDRPSLAEDLLSSSACDMENSAVPSQRSISSISASNQNPDPHSSSGSTNTPSEFVNHGLLRWNQERQQWVGDGKKRHNSKPKEPKLSWNATYENLLGTNKPFPQPIPLPEMIEFLVDVWNEEGLYD